MIGYSSSGRYDEAVSVDVLLFWRHPDDVEWGAGGIALLLEQKGVLFALIDSTRGEMGNRGTPADRYQEAEWAAQFLGGVPRESLGLPDCGLMDTPDARLESRDRFYGSLIGEHHGQALVSDRPAGDIEPGRHSATSRSAYPPCVPPK